MKSADSHNDFKKNNLYFNAVYHLFCSAVESAQRAHEICIEQTVEFPEHLITDPTIHDQIIGKVIALQQLTANHSVATIQYSDSIIGSEFTQLLNVLFGNISLQPGIKLVDFDLPDQIISNYRGPRFGQLGLRQQTDVWDRPLLCSALKPLGRSPQALAELAYQLALGGLDLIKDDHGITDQNFCPFNERVLRCTEVIARANRETGRNCLYLPNVTASSSIMRQRAEFAKNSGAGGVLICPGLTGLDNLRVLAADDTFALPILSHPAWQGSYCNQIDSGVAHGVLFGLLNRLAGADGTIFPTWGGRFAYTQAECHDLVRGATREFGALRPIFPIPAGGIRLARIKELIDFYGNECIFLIGGDLHAQGSDIRATCQNFINFIKN